MRTAVEGLLRGVAGSWDQPPITLRLIGSTALMLQTTFTRHTNDSDVLETNALDDVAQTRLLELAGPETVAARHWRVHIQVVRRGIPFLRPAAVWHALEIDGLDGRLRVEVLDVVDVVVSKLKRFDARDRSDIDAMIGLGRIEHAALLECFAAAFDRFLGDARADDLPTYVAHLNQVERDGLGVEESRFEYPEWIDDGT